MTRFHITATAALLLSAAAAHAQMPTDNAAWKGRCDKLATLDLAHLSPADKALSKGVPASKYKTFGFDRSDAQQHSVACTMFALGAIAAQNSGDAALAHDNLVLAAIERKSALHQDTTFSESMTRMKSKALELRQPSLTVADEEKALNAATTIPFAPAGNTTASLKR